MPVAEHIKYKLLTQPPRPPTFWSTLSPSSASFPVGDGAGTPVPSSLCSCFLFLCISEHLSQDRFSKTCIPFYILHILSLHCYIVNLSSGFPLQGGCVWLISLWGRFICVGTRTHVRMMGAACYPCESSFILPVWYPLKEHTSVHLDWRYEGRMCAQWCPSSFAHTFFCSYFCSLY